MLRVEVTSGKATPGRARQTVNTCGDLRTVLLGQPVTLEVNELDGRLPASVKGAAELNRLAKDGFEVRDFFACEMTN